MSIIPARVQEQVSHIDRTRSLYIGIAAGITALWSLYRVLWLFYAIFAGAVAAVFLLRYSKQP
jgi:hypothetical protein